MTRNLLTIALVLAFLPAASAVAQDDGPLVLTPPGIGDQPPPPSPVANQPAPLDLIPNAVVTTVMTPPMPRLRPATARLSGMSEIAALPEAGLAPPVTSDQTMPASPVPALAEQLAPFPTDQQEPQLRTADVPASGTAPGADAAPATTEVAALETPAATASEGEAGIDMAYGAFQRGYYLSAFSLAIPRAEAGDTAAQTLLGLIYEGGYGVPRDPARAASWYQFAADGGNREAQFALGMMYLDGRGVAADPAKAADYFEKASESGQIAATYNVALLYLEGKIRPLDVARAAKLFQQAAEASNPDAQYVLAQLYEEGRGVAENQEAATQWFAEAARLGNIPAQVEYAIRLFNGIGTQANEAAAANWFERAADVGNPIAQNRLARLLATGRGVEADPLAAAKWHVLAKRAGRDDDYLDQFFAGLTEEQRQTAIALAQRWPAD